MIGRFLRERISWILFFVFAHGLLLFVAYIDATIPITSIAYYVMLSMIAFVIFLAVRYQRETRFFKQLEERADDYHSDQMPSPGSPFEQILIDVMSEQAQLLKKESNTLYLSLETEKDQLLAWIHEVKTPLTALHLMIDRLENGPHKASLRYEWLRIHLLLDQQLHQKRLPFMENDLYIQQVDLENILHNELLTLRPWCMQKGIGFTLDLTQTSVTTDEKWLAFVLRQLLTNSIKYSENGEIIIRSWSERGITKLSIQDFGCGIDSKDLPRIFDQGFTSTSRHGDHGATGMGLYLTKKAVHTLRIDIAVESKLNEGTCVTLQFPKRNEYFEVMSM